MSLRWSPTRKYLLILCLCLCWAPVIAVVNYVFLKKSHEFERIDNIVRLQLQNQALFYPAIHEVARPYKLALWRRLKPKIVVLGSSRVQQLRGQYFTDSFTNLSGAMLTLKDGARVLKEMAAGPKPEVVIMGLDLWMFSNAGDSVHFTDYESTGMELQPDMLFQPCQWLWQGKLTIKYYLQILTGNYHQIFPALRVFATVNQEGFYTDGSMYNLGRITGAFKVHNMNRFINTMQDLQKGTYVFKPDRSIRADRWKEFVSLVKYAQQEKIHLITFMPPLPARIIDAMKSKNDSYAYVDSLRKKLPEVSPHHYDFFDPRDFGSDDCEFLDGLHGGEITYLRILSEIGKDPASGLGPYLRRQEIAECIRLYRGKAMVPPPFYPYPYREVDFLDLGCKKN